MLRLSPITFLPPQNGALPPLGVGDRHKHNLMVTTEGKFFHIDYGYALGLQPNTVHKVIQGAHFRPGGCACGPNSSAALLCLCQVSWERAITHRSVRHPLPSDR